MTDPEITVENRRKIYELIENFPGLHMRELQRKSDMSMNLVRYHLDQLERYGLVEVVEEEYKRYYPKKGEMRVDQRDKKYLSVLREEIPLSIILSLLDEGEPLAHGNLKENLDIPSSTLSYHLKKMTEKGILVKQNKEYWLKEPDKMAELLTKYEPPKDIIDEFIDLWESLSLGISL